MEFTALEAFLPDISIWQFLSSSGCLDNIICLSPLYITADYTLSETAIDEYMLQLLKQFSTQHMQK